MVVARKSRAQTNHLILEFSPALGAEEVNPASGSAVRLVAMRSALLKSSATGAYGVLAVVFWGMV